MDHLQEYLRPWSKCSEIYIPDNNNTGVNLEWLLSDDTDYGISIVERLNKDIDNALSDDDVFKLLYTLNIGLTGATTLQKKRDQFKQWITGSQDMHPYIGHPCTDIALKYRQRTGKKTGKKSTDALMQELMKKDRHDRGCPVLSGEEWLRQRLLAASIQSRFLKKLGLE
jgi:hypothetical protein